MLTTDPRPTRAPADPGQPGDPPPFTADKVTVRDWGLGPDGRRAVWIICESQGGFFRRFRISMPESGKIEVERWHGATIVIEDNALCGGLRA